MIVSFDFGGNQPTKQRWKKCCFRDLHRPKNIIALFWSHLHFCKAEVLPECSASCLIMIRMVLGEALRMGSKVSSSHCFWSLRSNLLALRSSKEISFILALLDTIWRRREGSMLVSYMSTQHLIVYVISHSLSAHNETACRPGNRAAVSPANSRAELESPVEKFLLCHR